MALNNLRTSAVQKWLVLALSLVLVLMTALLWSRPTAAQTSNTHSESALVIPQSKSALFVGDSFTAAAGVGGNGRSAYPFLACAAVGWGCNVDAQGGTGYIDDGHQFRAGIQQEHAGTQKAIDRLDGDKARYIVDVLVADLGRNDIGVESAAAILDAITAFFTKARSFWPDAVFIAIVPTFIDPMPYDNYEPLKSGLALIAENLNVKIIDPIADGWYRGVDTSAMEIEQDHIHPNAYGNQYISERIQDSLAALGVAAPRTVS
ncbi:lysophospholipase L1-like esterase [Mycobacterium sp. MAA66]|uniref:SGNH/GDSL hydrolase family protein n=1 Tax=Mycobacterium sp. MAA66 TaxID=3156297 RepID=UPI003519109C